jgi:hypothetical protein
MVLQDAYDRAQAFLDERVRPLHDADIVICSCQEFPSAWVFGYNTRALLDEGNISASLVGNGPVMVGKSGQVPYLADSASPIDGQL